jgi:hypothetical protein
MLRTRGCLVTPDGLDVPGSPFISNLKRLEHLLKEENETELAECEHYYQDIYKQVGRLVTWATKYSKHSKKNDALNQCYRALNKMLIGYQEKANHLEKMEWFYPMIFFKLMQELFIQGVVLRSRVYSNAVEYILGWMLKDNLVPVFEDAGHNGRRVLTVDEACMNDLEACIPLFDKKCFKDSEAQNPEGERKPFNWDLLRSLVTRLHLNASMLKALNFQENLSRWYREHLLLPASNEPWVPLVAGCQYLFPLILATLQGTLRDEAIDLLRHIRENFIGLLQHRNIFNYLPSNELESCYHIVRALDKSLEHVSKKRALEPPTTPDQPASIGRTLIDTELGQLMERQPIFGMAYSTGRLFMVCRQAEGEQQIFCQKVKLPISKAVLSKERAEKTMEPTHIEVFEMLKQYPSYTPQRVVCTNKFTVVGCRNTNLLVIPHNLQPKPILPIYSFRARQPQFNVKRIWVFKLSPNHYADKYIILSYAECDEPEITKLTFTEYKLGETDGLKCRVFAFDFPRSRRLPRAGMEKYGVVTVFNDEVETEFNLETERRQMNMKPKAGTYFYTQEGKRSQRLYSETCTDIPFMAEEFIKCPGDPKRRYHILGLVDGRVMATLCKYRSLGNAWTPVAGPMKLLQMGAPVKCMAAINFYTLYVVDENNQCQVYQFNSRQKFRSNTSYAVPLSLDFETVYQEDRKKMGSMHVDKRLKKIELVDRQVAFNPPQYGRDMVKLKRKFPSPKCLLKGNSLYVLGSSESTDGYRLRFRIKHLGQSERCHARLSGNVQGSYGLEHFRSLNPMPDGPIRRLESVSGTVALISANTVRLAHPREGETKRLGVMFDGIGDPTILNICIQDNMVYAFGANHILSVANLDLIGQLKVQDNSPQILGRPFNSIWLAGRPEQLVIIETSLWFTVDGQLCSWQGAVGSEIVYYETVGLIYLIALGPDSLLATCADGSLLVISTATGEPVVSTPPACLVDPCCRPVILQTTNKKQRLLVHGVKGGALAVNLLTELRYLGCSVVFLLENFGEGEVDKLLTNDEAGLLWVFGQRNEQLQILSLTQVQKGGRILPPNPRVQLT